MKNQKYTNIIPVSFVPGSGGRFLNYILNSARSTTTIKSDIDLEYMYKLVMAFGNMKLQSQSMLVSSQDQINELINYSIDYDSDVVEYCSCNVSDISTLIIYFEKVIQVSYDESDIPDITFSFISENTHDDVKQAVTATANANMKIVNNFKEVINDSSLLYVSWKELYKDDIDKLVSKLSDFSNLPKDNFKVNDIIEWRNTTSNNIQKVKELLGETGKKIIVWKTEGNTTYRNKLLQLHKYNTGD